MSYSFTIQEVNRDLLEDKLQALRDAALTVAPVGVQGDTALHGTIDGDIKGQYVKLSYSWTNSNNVNFQVLEKPMLVPNAIVEYAIRTWFHLKPPVEPTPEPQPEPVNPAPPVVNPTLDSTVSVDPAIDPDKH